MRKKQSVQTVPSNYKRDSGSVYARMYDTGDDHRDRGRDQSCWSNTSGRGISFLDASFLTTCPDNSLYEIRKTKIEYVVFLQLICVER